MSSKILAKKKWKLIHKRVKKHLSTLKIQDNETENNIQKEREIRTVKNCIASKYLNSNILEHCQQLNAFYDNKIAENVDNNISIVQNVGENISTVKDTDDIIFYCASDTFDNRSCSSIENYVIEDEDNSNNSNVEFVSANNNSINIFEDCRNSNLSNNLAQWAVKFKISHVALHSLLYILKKYKFTLPNDPRTLLKTQKRLLFLICIVVNTVILGLLIT